MVEITENIKLRKIWWLKLPKTLKYAKSDGWCCQNIVVLKIWRLKITKTLNNEKSDGWSIVKPWSTQNLIVEVA